MSRLRNCLLLFPLLLFSMAARAESQEDLLTRFVAARDQANLVSPTTKPWHMAVTFELLDSDGKEKERGTLEEWWASPTHWRQSFNSPSFVHDRIRDGARQFVTSQATTPYFQSLLLHNLLSPLPHFGHDNPKLKSEDRAYSNHHFDCLTTDFAPENRTEDRTNLPIFCFDRGSNELRFTSRFGIEMVVFNRPANFQNQNVNLDLTILENLKAALHAAVTSLQSITPDDTHLVVPAGFVPADKSGQPTLVPFPPKKLRGPEPVLPIGTPRNKMTGTVLLDTQIAEDGHIVSVEPLFSTDPLLEDAAMDAVKHWVYQPYLLDGKPIAVQTPIRINFVPSH